MLHSKFSKTVCPRITQESVIYKWVGIEKLSNFSILNVFPKLKNMKIFISAYEIIISKFQN